MSPPEDKVERDPEELRRQREREARESNSRRNSERISRYEQIADSAEQSGEHIGDQDLTEEMLADDGLSEEQVNARAMAKAEAREEQPEDTQIIDAEGEPTNDQVAETADDAARDAGADDVRIVEGVKQYRLVINGKEVWKTLAEIRTSAQKVESADEYLQTAAETARRATREAEPRHEPPDATRAERRSKLKALLQRQALGDEQAIDELTELLEAGPSVVTPDVLHALDERFDSRVTFREAVTWFESEQGYADVLKHPAMKSYAGELDAQLARANPNMPPMQRLKQVGEQIRREMKDTFGIVKGQSSGPSAKAIRKSEGARPVSASGARQPQAEPAEEVDDPQSVIERMAQSRRQPRAVVHGPVRGRS